MGSPLSVVSGGVGAGVSTGGVGSVGGMGSAGGMSVGIEGSAPVVSVELFTGGCTGVSSFFLPNNPKSMFAPF